MSGGLMKRWTSWANNTVALGWSAVRREAFDISSWDSLDEEPRSLAQSDEDDASWSLNDEMPWSLRFWCSAEPLFRFVDDTLIPESLPFFSVLFCLHAKFVFNCGVCREVITSNGQEAHREMRYPNVTSLYKFWSDLNLIISHNSLLAVSRLGGGAKTKRLR